MVYAFAGWIFVLMGLNAVLLVLGGWFYKARMVGMFCHHFLLVITIAALVVTHKYRYRDQGVLAAMSTMPSKTLSSTEYDPNWTYQNDAHFIEKIWAWEMVTFFVCLVTANFGCFKIWNRTDVRDSQVRSTLANSAADQERLVY